MKGTIKDGLGEGAFYIEQYAEKFNKALGYTPFFGTLNLEVDADEFTAFKQGKEITHIEGFEKAGQTFGEVDFFEATINESIPCAVLIIERTRHAPNIIEVIAEKNIRECCNLKENDTIVLN